MLNPIRRVGSQFVEYLRHHQPMTKEEARARACELLSQMGLPDGEAVLGAIPSRLSGGMRQRVGIAMAMAFQPKLLLADEPTSALDATIQAQILGELLNLREKSATTLLMVTHNLGVAGHMADRILVLHQGTVVETGTPQEILAHPKEAYTQKLVASVPRLSGGSYV